MHTLIRCCVPVLIAIAVVGAVYAAAPPPRADVSRTFEGKVVPLADLVAASGSKLDADAAPHWLALACDDGKVYPLVKDGGGRLFFVDKALQGRPMRVTGKLIAGGSLLRVLSAQSVLEGVPHEVYYWCDICSIRRGEKMVCECCNGKMDLIEQPARK